MEKNDRQRDVTDAMNTVSDERVDLDRFRLKEPQEWGMDDVVAWMIAIARRHQIPVEDMNIHKFASCTGPLLLLMSEQHFIDRDVQFGSMLYREFRKLVSGWCLTTCMFFCHAL